MPPFLCQFTIFCPFVWILHPFFFVQNMPWQVNQVRNKRKTTHLIDSSNYQKSTKIKSDGYIKLVLYFSSVFLNILFFFYFFLSAFLNIVFSTNYFQCCLFLPSEILISSFLFLIILILCNLPQSFNIRKILYQKHILILSTSFINPCHLLPRRKIWS